MSTFPSARSVETFGTRTEMKNINSFKAIKPKKVANWLMGETLRLLKENGQEPEDLQFFTEASGIP